MSKSRAPSTSLVALIERVDLDLDLEVCVNCSTDITIKFLETFGSFSETFGNFPLMFESEKLHMYTVKVEKGGFFAFFPKF